MEVPMRKVIYGMLVSLDGFIEGPNRELDWHVVDEELHLHANEQAKTTGVFLLGRRMYEAMTYWDTADKNESNPRYVLEFARIWQSVPKLVYSRTLEKVGPNATLVRDVSADKIAELKAQPGGDLSVGGADLASTFIKLGLVDEYQLYVQPVVLGSGTPMFKASDRRISMRLIEVSPFKSGVVYTRYAPD